MPPPLPQENEEHGREEAGVTDLCPLTPEPSLSHSNTAVQNPGHILNKNPNAWFEKKKKNVVCVSPLCECLHECLQLVDIDTISFL